MQLTVRAHANLGGGNAVAARSGSADFLMSVQHAEAIACMKGLEFASTLGMRRVIVETDAALVAKMLSNPTYDRSVLDPLIGEIRSLMYTNFSECFVSHVSRVCNVVVDTLAAMGLNCNDDGPRLWKNKCQTM
jgi:ribonuclease HI